MRQRVLADRTPVTRLLAHALAVERGGRPVLRDVSFALDAGEALLVGGRNGAGKTTLLRALAGLVPLAGGRLLWEGEDALADRTEHARRLAFLGHADALKPGLTARENLFLHARLGGLGAAAIGDGLRAVGLETLADVPAARLSAGQRRRLALARTFLRPAALVLLDEPATALDAASVAALGRLLAAHRARGGSVIASAHGTLPLTDAASLALP